MSDERTQSGKYWAGRLFEKIRDEYKHTVEIEKWGWKDNWPAYFIWLHIEGRDDIDFIPSQDRGFTQGQIDDRGNPDPVNDPSRQDVEATIRWKFELLAKQN